MFNEIHNSFDSGNAAKNIQLAFIKSLNVQAFPCGRRRALVDLDGSTNSQDDRYYIPFDPEARLNTEANNRKHSGLNGYKQSYIRYFDSANKRLSIVIEGYLFNINLDEGYDTVDSFCKELVNVFSNATTEIYANIRLDAAHLYSSTDRRIGDLYTDVLRDQTNTQQASTSIDLLIQGVGSTQEARESSNNYYFSGLSLSVEALADVVDKNEVVFSLKLFEKSDSSDEWKIYQPSLLPDIDHGEDEDSVVIKKLTVNSLTQNGVSVPSMKVIDNQLCFYNVEIE